jgi:hypothetical protein
VFRRERSGYLSHLPFINKSNELLSKISIRVGNFSRTVAVETMPTTPMTERTPDDDYDDNNNTRSSQKSEQTDNREARK